MNTLKLIFTSMIFIIAISSFAQTQDIDIQNPQNELDIQAPQEELEVEDQQRTNMDEALWKKILYETNKKSKIKLIERYKAQQFKRHIAEADESLEFILWQGKNYKRYLRNFPNGQFAEEARAKIEQRKERVDRVFNSLGNAATTAAEFKASKSNPEQLTNNNGVSQNSGSKTYIKNMGNSNYKGTYLQAQKNIKTRSLSADYNKSQSALGCRWEIINQAGGKVFIKNIDHGQYLRFVTRGNKIGFSPDNTLPGSIWEIVKVENNQVLIKGFGISNKTIFLRLTAEGKLIPSTSSNFSGCKWIIE